MIEFSKTCFYQNSIFENFEKPRNLFIKSANFCFLFCFTMSPLQKNLKKKQGTERNRREIKIRKIMTDEQTIPLKVLVPEQGKKEYAQPYVTS